MGSHVFVVPIQDFQANQSVREDKTFVWPLAEWRWRTWSRVWLVWITGCAFWCSDLLQSSYLLMACSVLVIQHWTSYLITGAWTAKLCVSDIVRGASCQLYRLWVCLMHDWMQAISMALARSLGSSQSAVRPTSHEESSDRGSETPGGGAPRVQLETLYAEIYEAKHAAGDFAHQMHYTFEPSACHTRSVKPAQKPCSDKSHLKPGLSDGCLKATSESRCPCNPRTTCAR